MSTGTEPPKSMQPCQVKLVLLGTSAVGKSSIVLRFVQNDFQENKEPTIGAAFLTQKCRLEDKVIKFDNAAAAVVVYDITVESSLAKAQSWVKELQRQSNPNIVIALVGNKLDLVSSSSSDAAAEATPSNATAEDEEADDATATPDTPNGDASKRQVAKETAAAYAAENGLLFFETSAKTGDNVVEVFTEIAKKIPLDQILQQRGQGAGAGGRAGASRTASGANANAAGGQAGRVQLGDNAEAKTDSCAC